MLNFIKSIFGKKKASKISPDLPGIVETDPVITADHIENKPESVPNTAPLPQKAPEVVTNPPKITDLGYPFGNRPPEVGSTPADTNKAKKKSAPIVKKQMTKEPMKANLPPQPNVGTNEVNAGALNVGSNLGSLFISTVNNHIEIRNQPDNQGSFARVKAGLCFKYNDLAKKAYVDAITSGYTIQAEIDAASTGTNVNLTTNVENGDSLDQFILFTNQLIMIKDQTNPTQNGIYIVSQEGAPTRYTAADMLANTIFYVSQGIINHETFWKVVGTFTGPGGQPNYGVDAINFIPVTMHPGGGGTVTLNGTAPIIVDNPSAGTYDISFGTSGVTAGTYNTVTVDPNGIITFGTNVPYTGSGTVTEVDTGAGLTGGPITTNGTISLSTTGVTPGTYQGLTINQYGQITNATNENYGTGSVTQVFTGTGLVETSTPITNTGTISMATSGVVAGTYGNSTNIPQITVDALGRVLSATNITVSSGFFWNNVPGVTQAMLPNNGYISSNPALTTMTLPTTCPQGAVLAIAGVGAGGWKLAQNAGQTIHFGDVDSTTGAAGFLSSNNKYDYIELLCVIANTDFIVKASVGNINVL